MKHTPKFSYFTLVVNLLNHMEFSQNFTYSTSCRYLL